MVREHRMLKWEDLFKIHYMCNLILFKMKVKKALINGKV